MADTDVEGVIPFIDGDGRLRFQLALEAPFRTIAPETAVRSNGAVVDGSNPFPVAASVPPLTYSGAASASVGTASGPLITPGTYTRTVTIGTLPASSTNVWLRPDGGQAAPNTGILVKSGGGQVTFGIPGLPLPTGIVNAITDAGVAQTVLLFGG